MERNTVDLKKFAVRIRSGETLLGSGTLWKPQKNEHNKLYVLTAAHVVKDKENIEIEFLRDNKCIALPVQSNMVELSETYHNEGDYGDVAIISLDYEYEDLDGYKFVKLQNGISMLSSDANLCLIGFPENGGVKKSIVLSRDELQLRYLDVDNECYTLKYKVLDNLNTADRNEEIIGFSGGGLFWKTDSGVYFVGIHKGALGDNASRGNLIGTTSDFMRELCCKNQLDTPQFIDEIDGNLSDQEEYLKEEVLNVRGIAIDDYTKLCAAYSEIYQKDMTDVINSTFYDFCEECKYKKNFHQCENFRGFLLVLTIFLKIVNENVDLEKPQVDISGNIPVYFICSEGKGSNSQAKLTMSHFVCALKSDKELMHRLEDNCIIIWGTEKGVRNNEKACSNTEFNNIVFDISRKTGNGLSIADVHKETNPKVIIHIDEIIDMLHEGNLAELKKRFVEYIEELEK